MLDYLGNLMEDASDFSWEAAKASHVIALTNMEADRLKWTDTEKLDRIRRAHAQRHVNVGKTSNSKALLALLLLITGLLGSILGMLVSHVMDHMLHVYVPRSLIKKTREPLH